MRKNGYIICVDELDTAELPNTTKQGNALVVMNTYAWNISNLYEQHELGISASGRFCSIFKAQVFDTEDEAEDFLQKQTDRLSKKTPSARLSISKVTNW